MKVFAGTACACVAPLAHRVLEALVQMRVFPSNKEEPDKSGVGPWMEDESVEIVVVGCDECADSGGEPGSGDEDALRSFAAKDRAWHALREEKRVHARTKKQLVEVSKRVAVLERRLAAVDGQGEAEAVERTLMQLEDRDVSVATLKANVALASAQVSTFDTNLQRAIAAHVVACEKSRCDQLAARMKLELELEALQSRYEAISERLVDAESDANHWKAQQESVLSELAAERQEAARLAEELRAMKKTAVLMVNRQHVQLHARAMSGGAPQSLPHLPKRSNNDSNTRSFTHVKTGRGSATA
ncbi:hypothetical protein BBJ28_00020953 [Nothophytophthora sp. Chile5]|nr:hypothetical protein BBJ28_00020953 [Nothophytophthora sp. Chile5]